MTEQMGQTETPDDRVDEFCYELALILRRVLDLDGEEFDDETLDAG